MFRCKWTRSLVMNKLRDERCVELLTDPDFLSKVVTNDKNWVNGYHPETKQSSQWKNPFPPQRLVQNLW